MELHYKAKCVKVIFARILNTCDKHVGTLLLADVLSEKPIESIGSYEDNQASVHATFELHKMEHILNHLRSLPSSQPLPYVTGWCNWLNMIYTPHKIAEAILSQCRIHTDFPDTIDNLETAESWMPEFSVCRSETPRVTSGSLYYPSLEGTEETKLDVAGSPLDQLFSSQLAYPRTTPKKFNHDHWVISAVNSYGTRRYDGSISGAHAFLVVEGRRGDQFFIGKYEISAQFPPQSWENPNPSGDITRVKVIESLLPVRDTPEFIENILRYNNQRCSFKVLRTDAENMIISIRRDARITEEANRVGSGHIPYQFFGMTGLGMLFTAERDGSLNCASWCFEKLTIAKAPVTKKQSKKSSDPNVVAGGCSSLVTRNPPDSDANSASSFSFCRTS